MQMHESSLKWEEFETSVFTIGFILKRKNMLPYTNLYLKHFSKYKVSI